MQKKSANSLQVLSYVSHEKWTFTFKLRLIAISSSRRAPSFLHDLYMLVTAGLNMGTSSSGHNWSI